MRYTDCSMSKDLDGGQTTESGEAGQPVIDAAIQSSIPSKSQRVIRATTQYDEVSSGSFSLHMPNLHDRTHNNQRHDTIEVNIHESRRP